MNKNVILRKVKLDTELDKNILILRKQQCVNSFFFVVILKEFQSILKKRRKGKRVHKKWIDVTMRCTASTQNHFVGVILEEAWGRGAVYSRWKTFERTKFATRLSQQALHRPRLKKRERKRKKEKEGRLFSGLSRYTNVFRKISSRYAHFYGPDGGST